MENKKLFCFVLALAILQQCLNFGILVYEPDTQRAVHTHHVSQAVSEWSMQPFTDLVLTEETSCPYTHPHEFVYSVWPGTQLGCVCWDN